MPKGSLTEPDARGTGYQHPGFRAHDSNGKPGRHLSRLAGGRFTLLTCAEHLDELRATLREPAIAGRIKPHKAGRLINQVKSLAEDIDPLPRVERSPDPTDD